MNTDGEAMDVPEAKERLMADLKGFIGDAEELLHAVTSRGGENLNALRAEFEQKLTRAKGLVSEMEDSARVQYEQAASVADEYVHSNPWRAIGIAAAVGVVVGFLMSRR